MAQGERMDEMPSFWQKAQEYLGLVDEDDLEGYETQTDVATAETARPAGRRVEPPATARRAVVQEGRGYEPTVVVQGSGAVVRPVASIDAQCEIIQAFDFGDAKLVADRIRERTPVLLNLRDTDPDMVRRLVDFGSGLTYALDGTMSKVSEGVILILPPRMSLGREEKRRLAELGLYSLSDAGT